MILNSSFTQFNFNINGNFHRIFHRNILEEDIAGHFFLDVGLGLEVLVQLLIQKCLIEA